MTDTPRNRPDSMIRPTCNNEHRKMALGVVWAMHPEILERTRDKLKELRTHQAVRSLRFDLDGEAGHNYYCVTCGKHHMIDSAIGRKHDLPQPVPPLAIRQSTAAMVREEAQELLDEADRIEKWARP